MTNQQSIDKPTAERPQALLYLRCASGHQADRDRAIVAQHHLCTRRAEELGAVVVGEFVDFGSGLSLERPGLADLIAKVVELRRTTNRLRLYVITATTPGLAAALRLTAGCLGRLNGLEPG